MRRRRLGCEAITSSEWPETGAERKESAMKLGMVGLGRMGANIARHD